MIDTYPTPPPKEKIPAAVSSEDSSKTPTGTHPKTPTYILNEEARAREKSLATTAAKLALLGAEFHELNSGACIVSCGGVVRHFDNRGEVERLLSQVVRK